MRTPHNTACQVADLQENEGRAQGREGDDRSEDPMEDGDDGNDDDRKLAAEMENEQNKVRAPLSCHARARLPPCWLQLTGVQLVRL